MSPYRLLGGDEDLVAVLETEARDIDRQMVLVRHRQIDGGDVGERVEDGLPHGVQRMLHGFAVMLGEDAEQRRADGVPGRPEFDLGIAVTPFRGERRRENPVAGFGQSRKLVARESFERRVAGFENHQIGDAGTDQDAFAVSVDGGGTGFPTSAGECLSVHAFAPRNAAPQMLGEIDADPGQPLVALEEMPGEREPERFGLTDPVARGQRVDGVLHRIGRQHGAVVAVRVRLVILALEPDRDGQIAEIVPIGSAAKLHEADPRFAIR